MNDVFLNDLVDSDPTRTIEKSFEYFQSSLIRHCVQRPPSSIEIFNREDVNKIVAHALESYFRQYDLFKYVFTERIQVKLTQVDPHGIEVPLQQQLLSSTSAVYL